MQADRGVFAYNEERTKVDMKNRNVSIIRDTDDNKIVVIHDIRFKGKRSVWWEDVEEYLKEYIGEFYEIASNKRFDENKKEKHKGDAAFGWYRYNSRFALPVFNENGKIERYNVFNAVILIRHDKDGKLYLYDIINIKKETSNPPRQ